jgi:ketosteroid isomerase-like protein
VSEKNVEILRRIYERFNERDMDATWELIAPDAKFRFIVWGPDMNRTYQGREATTEFWQEEVFSVFPDFHMEPEAFVDEGERVVATIHNTGQGSSSGIEVDLHTAVLAEFRDAKLVSLEVFETRAEALEAAGMSAT